MYVYNQIKPNKYLGVFIKKFWENIKNKNEKNTKTDM